MLRKFALSATFVVFAAALSTSAAPESNVEQTRKIESVLRSQLEIPDQRPEHDLSARPAVDPNNMPTSLRPARSVPIYWAHTNWGCACSGYLYLWIKYPGTDWIYVGYISSPTLTYIGELPRNTRYQWAVSDSCYSYLVYSRGWQRARGSYQTIGTRCW